jgi:hypothetical protein
LEFVSRLRIAARIVVREIRAGCQPLETRAFDIRTEEGPKGTPFGHLQSEGLADVVGVMAIFRQQQKLAIVSTPVKSGKERSENGSP